VAAAGLLETYSDSLLFSVAEAAPLSNSATIGSGGSGVIGGGETVSNTNVNGGNLDVSSGGTSVSATAQSGGVISVKGGNTENTTLSAGGAEIVENGGTSTNITIESGGTQTVESGGLVVSGNVNSNGTQYVKKAAVVSNVSVNKGTQYIDGGTAIGGLIIGYITHQDVKNGGVTKDITVNGFGANQFIHDGGTAIGTSVTNGAGLAVSSGGTLISANINKGKSWAYAATTIYSGGVASNTIVDNGYFNVAGGTSYNSIICNNGQENIREGGIAIGDTVSNNGEQTISRPWTRIYFLYPRHG
jgi:autotransporter passenger strand-loop-strand repeat protein